MYFNLARTITSLVVLLMVLEIFGAAITAALPSASTDTLTLHEHKPPSSVLAAYLFEKTEEETEETEEEKDRMSRVILLDFSRIAFSISFHHTPQVEVSVRGSQYDVRPPLHELNCVFLI
jgi:hypothetical protein